MYAEAVQYVKTCGKCQQHGKAPSQVPPKGHPSSSVPGERWMLDCLHVNEEQLVKGGPTYNSIVVAIDVCSRCAAVAPLTNLTSDTLKEFLVNRVYGPFGHPAELLIDGGPEFRKHFEQACLDLTGRQAPFNCLPCQRAWKGRKISLYFLTSISQNCPTRR